MKKTALGLALLSCVVSGVTPDLNCNIMSVCSLAEAAEKGLHDSDFGYKGLMLGDEVDKMRDILGEPLYDKDLTVQGVPLKVFEYHEAKVGIVKATGRVADIALSGQDYVLRDNVRYGATSYWLQKVYGKTERAWQDGVPYFIYSRPGHAHEHILFELNPNDWSLVKTRITVLPLTDEEADRMVIEGADVEEGLEDVALEVKMGEKAIDTSALPETDVPKLRMGGQPE